MTNPSSGLRARMANDPYLHLARHRPFALFWIGQAVSLLGDRLNQVALAFLVYSTTNSPLMTSLVFAAAWLPNLVVGPLGGVAADRFNRRRLMVDTDLLRAVLVLTIPFVVTISPLLALAVVFLVSCASLIFRPAKMAVIPDLAPEGEIQAASGAIWMADSLADLIGFPIAGLLVALLSPIIALAFVLDAASYVFSAICLLRLPIRPVTPPPSTGQGVLRQVGGELIAGWRYLRGSAALFENTLLSMVAQVSVGFNVALLIVFARESLEGGDTAYVAYYAALNTAVGIGAVAGSWVTGYLKSAPRGPLILVGFATMGIAIIGLGASSTLPLALLAITAVSVTNMIWVVPIQPLIFAHTPPALLGRVMALRSTLVFGTITAAMFVGGLLTTQTSAANIIIAGGLLTLVAALVGTTRRALRAP